MRTLVCVVCLCLLAAACGSSPTQPSPPTQPPAPPAPQFPSMMGAWNGTTTIVAVVGTVSGSNVCTQSWLITSQTQGSFSGSFQLSGGTTVACASAGTVSGTIATNGAISGLTFSAQISPPNPGCTKTSGDTVFSGLLTNATLTATASDAFLCNGIAASRNLTLSIQK